MKLGIVMDPIASIRIQSDSTLAIMLEAQKRGWELYYMEAKDLYVIGGEPMALAQKVKVFNDPQKWFETSDPKPIELGELDGIFMRKDPPFNMEYIYATYILEAAEKKGCAVFNKPESLRDCNEKFFTTYFAQWMAPTLVTKNVALIQDFVRTHEKAVLKPMDWMGGTAIFNLRHDDPNLNMILENFVSLPDRTVMIQKFVPEIATHGDKRIILIDGEPLPYVFTRIPKIAGTPANTARGGSPVKAEYTQRDRDICRHVGPVMKERGLLFSAIDVIGDYLTEINVTSPTGLRYVEKLFGYDACPAIVDKIEEKCG